MSRSGIEDDYVSFIADHGPEKYVLVEMKMTRGSTHDKDRAKVAGLVGKADLAGGMERMRDHLKAHMADARSFDPDGASEPGDAGDQT